MADRSKRSKRSAKSTNHLRRARGQGDDGTSEVSRNSEASRHSDASRHSEPPRNSSARSSTYYDDASYHQNHQAPEGHSQGYGAPSIRSTASRFSLNEQFASTRREIEFDFDDSSSVFGRSTIASQPLDDLVPNDAVQHEPVTPRLSNIDNFYDLLCVSRDPSTESIRRAYFRLLTLLYPDTQPPHLRHAAGVYFTAIQTAFETLLDPCRRLKYDFDCLHDGSFNANVGVDQQYEDYRRWYIELLSNREQQANVDAGLDSWELGARFDAQEVFTHLKHGLEHGTATIEPVDFEMGHSFLIHLPRLDHQLRHATRIVQQSLPVGLVAQQKVLAVQADNVGLHGHPTSGTSGGTVLVIRSSVYGFLQHVPFLPIITLLDPYQPSLSTTPTKDRLVQLHVGKVHPLIAIRLRHNLSRRILGHSHAKVEHSTNDSAEDQDDTIIEAETEVLPEPAVSIGLSRRIAIPYDETESVVQIGARSTLWNKRIPRLWLSLRRPTTEGALLCSIDSGDWQMRADETCRILSDYSARIKRKILHVDLPLYRTPKVELAYKIGGSFGPRETLMVDRLSDRGIRGLDKGFENSKVASWTVSAAAEPSYLSTSLKYVRDVGFWPLQQMQNDSIEHVDAYSKRPGYTHNREVRIEVELSSSSLWTGYLALRFLKRVGRFSKLGFELGLSSYSLHLSVYWSRLGRRINLPFLMCSRENLNTAVLFWTTLVPFTSFAIWEAWSRYRRLRQYRQRLIEEKAKSTLQDDQGYKRVEADQVASLMAAGVQTKMRAEYASNGLVVLSAKYGVKAQGTSNAWGAEEVADVTVPVAALVDGGRLCVPAGVCKSNILGFWDPSPGEEKVLHVRYTYKGKEATVEINGDDEAFVIPPPPA